MVLRTLRYCLPCTVVQEQADTYLCGFGRLKARWPGTIVAIVHLGNLVPIEAVLLLQCVCTQLWKVRLVLHWAVGPVWQSIPTGLQQEVTPLDWPAHPMMQEQDEEVVLCAMQGLGPKQQQLHRQCRHQEAAGYASFGFVIHGGPVETHSTCCFTCCSAGSPGEHCCGVEARPARRACAVRHETLKAWVMPASQKPKRPERIPSRTNLFSGVDGTAWPTRWCKFRSRENCKAR